MKWIKHVTLVCGLSVLLSACSFYDDVKVLEVFNVEVLEFSTDIVHAAVEVQVDNPNWYNIKLIDSDLDLFVNGKSMGHVTLVEQVEIPKKSVSTQKIEVVSDIKDAQTNLLQNALSLLFKRTATFEIKGWVKARGAVVSKKVPVSIEEEINIRDIGL